MTKRKRSTPKETTPGMPAESGEGDPTVHVSSDMLAGAPDVFAPGKEMPVESSESSAMTADVKPEEDQAPAAETASAFDESQSTEAPAEPAAAEAAITPPPPPPHPHTSRGPLRSLLQGHRSVERARASRLGSSSWSWACSPFSSSSRASIRAEAGRCSSSSPA